MPRRDENEIAYAGLRELIKRDEIRNPSPPKSAKAVAAGRLGGQKGGVARKRKLSPLQRSEIAVKAARTRWSKKKELS